MRLYPPVASVLRILMNPTEIDGHLMPEGTYVGCNMYAIHHNPEVWNNPEVCNTNE